MYALIITVAALLIALTHNLGFYNFHVDSIDSGIANTLVLCFFLWLNVYIAKIGYEQIEHSYEQAVRYSTELEQTNSELDQRVKERTRELENSWIKNVKSLERAATMGQLTASLLHDLKSPLSSFNLSMEALRSRSKDNKEVKDLQNAYEQIIKIMEDTEGLMKDNKVEVEFDIQHQVDTAVKLMENILKKENVALRKIYKGSKTIQGSSTLFLRIILNILMNSVEELSRSNNKNKQIEISLYNNNKTQNIVIRDNGSGIPKEQMSKIFKPGYGTKMDGNHYGLGLSFVKKTVEEEFGGQISIRSEINKFTEIRIII